MSTNLCDVEFTRHVADIRDCITGRISALIEQLRNLQSKLLQELLTIESEYKNETNNDDLSKQILVQWDNKIEDFPPSCKLTVIEKINTPSPLPPDESSRQYSNLKMSAVQSAAVSSPPLDTTDESVLGMSGFAMDLPDNSTLNNHSNYNTQNPEYTNSVQDRSPVPPERSAAHSYGLTKNKPKGLIEMYQSVTLPAYSACPYGTLNSQLQSPRGVAIDRKSNRIYIADRGNQRIQVFSDTGKFIFGFTHQEMQGPKGICIMEKPGLLFITACDKNSVHCYTLDGQFVRKVGVLGYGPGRLIQPCGITTDSMCKVYVCDFGNNRIQVFNQDLNYLTVLTNKVTKPTDIKVIKDTVFILDQRKLCISIFNKGGAYIAEVVTCGPEWYQIKHPYFFDIDYMGNFVLSDFANHCIKVFSPKGVFLCSFGFAGEEEGQFLQPRGIALVDDCIVTICERVNYQLQIFLLNPY